MQYSFLGCSGLRVSRISVGSVTFGDNPEGIGGVTVNAVRDIVDRLLDSGVNLMDTADAYSGGLAEEILGDAIKGRRDRLLLATKVRFPTGDGPNDAGLSRLHIINSCDTSLRRLGTDHIDLYQLHGWDGQAPLEETLSTLDVLVQQGKVRYIGCSNYSAWHLMKALSVSDRLGLCRFISHQIYYSLIGRDAEYELVPAGLDQGVGTLVWSPLAGGLLSGKYRRGAEWPLGARHSGDWHEPPVSNWEFVYDVIDVVCEVAATRGATPAQVALAYLMSKPSVSSVIVGVRKPGQLEDNLAAVDLTLSTDEIDKLDSASALPLLYPYWHQRRLVRDRMSSADASLLAQRHWSGAT
ncbi:MAG TPA: aldo/keto reductase [Acidimicrobiales bacterium]|nr:aldo/keto reductase [Acidimicrobiales bacterium]